VFQTKFNYIFIFFNLVYYASGNYKLEYQSLPYDNIFLIDKSHKQNDIIIKVGKVTSIKIDVLKATDYLKYKNRLFCFN